MDMKKTGDFLKFLRKEKGLTQEQLAEILGVAGRTVSRWETASNMPDLSILIQISDFFNVDIKEILDGEKKKESIDKEFKETLIKVADYDKTKNKMVAKISKIGFLSTISVGMLVLLIQFMVFNDIRFIIGEAVTLFIGGITEIILTAHSGLWDENSKHKNNVLRNLAVSVATATLFTFAVSFFIYQTSNNIPKTIAVSFCFFFSTSLTGFIVLTILSAWSNKREIKKSNAKR